MLAVHAHEAPTGPATGWVIPDALAWTIGLTAGALSGAEAVATDPDPLVVTVAVAFGLHQVFQRITPRPTPPGVAVITDFAR